MEQAYDDDLNVLANSSTTDGFGRADNVNDIELRTGTGRRIRLDEETAERVQPGEIVSALFSSGDANRPDTDDESSLPQIVGLLRPVWVIIDPWQHYLQVQRVTVAAGPGAEKLLLGDIVDWAREYEVAVTVSHDTEKNRPGAHTDSAVLGATDMIVSLGPGKSPTTLRLQPSGRWHLDPVDIRWTSGRGYSVVKDTEQGRSRTDARRIDDRVVLHLYELGADTRLPARGLAASLGCQGRRYDELRSALDRLLAEGIVDRAQRSGASSSRGRGYALTESASGDRVCHQWVGASGTRPSSQPWCGRLRACGCLVGAGGQPASHRVDPAEAGTQTTTTRRVTNRP